MLIKIDNIVHKLLSEDHDDVIAQMKNSQRMYNWVKGENVENVVESFAIANPRATFGEMMDWAKKTHMERLTAFKNSTTFTNYKQGNFDPTAPTSQIVNQHAAPTRGITEINDAIPARLKVRDDLKKVAEPGNEPEELGENPGLPDASITALPPTTQEVPTTPTTQDPLAKFKRV